MAAIIRLLRPSQWVKNVFVFAGLLFGHQWSAEAYVVAALTAFAAFCLTASSIYVVNDIADAAADRMHPVKCRRPIASGAVGVPLAALLAGLLGVAGMALAWCAGDAVLLIVLSYAGINFLYSWCLKHVVILDVFLISAGFMLRLLAGTAGIGIPPSKWLLVCGLMITLFLGFAKRRAELAQAMDEVGKQRRVLDHYSLPLLDKFIGITASATIITYSLYTLAPDTIAIHRTENLIYTVPPVLYAMFRYLYLIHFRNQGEDPAKDLFRDSHILAAATAWGFLSVALLL